MDDAMIITLFSSLYPCREMEMLASEGADARDVARSARRMEACGCCRV